MNIVIIWISSYEGGCLSLIPGDYIWTTLFHPKSCSGTLSSSSLFSLLLFSLLPSPFHLVLRILSHSSLLIVLLLNLKEEESWSKNKKKRVEKSGRKITVRENEGWEKKKERRGRRENSSEKRKTESITLSNAHLYSLGAEPALYIIDFSTHLCIVLSFPSSFYSLPFIFLSPLFLGESFLSSSLSRFLI